MKKWTEEMDRVLLERYPDEESGKLAEEFGYGLRTIERHAAWLGLKKSPEMLSRMAKRASDAATEWIRMKKARGEKIVKTYNGLGFKKGHRWDQETETRRHEAIRQGLARKGYLEKSSRMRKFAENMKKDDVRKLTTQELEHLLKKKVDEVVMLRQELDRRKGEKVELKQGRDVNFEEYVTK